MHKFIDFYSALSGETSITAHVFIFKQKVRKNSCIRMKVRYYGEKISMHIHILSCKYMHIQFHWCSTNSCVHACSYIYSHQSNRNSHTHTCVPNFTITKCIHTCTHTRVCAFPLAQNSFMRYCSLMGSNSLNRKTFLNARTCMHELLLLKHIRTWCMDINALCIAEN